jgi:hypothetical protein
MKILAGISLLLALLAGCSETPVSPHAGASPLSGGTASLALNGATQMLHFDQSITDPDNKEITYEAVGDIAYTLNNDVVSPVNQVDVSLSVKGQVWDSRLDSPVGMPVSGKDDQAVTLQAKSPSAFRKSFPIISSNQHLYLTFDFGTDGKKLSIQKISILNLTENL